MACTHDGLATHSPLVALRACSAAALPAGVDAVTLARYSNAVLGAAQGLLEGEQTPPPALLPLLAVLQAAARHQHSLKCVRLWNLGRVVSLGRLHR